MQTNLDQMIELVSSYAPSININRTFYFDESNNIRKGIIREVGDNNPDLENLCFVLGGVILNGPLNFDELLQDIGAKQVPKDAKFNFFAFKKSKFEDVISNSRLRKLFEYLLNNNILIHFFVLHYMHFALVDILDSLIQENDINQQAALSYYQHLQSDMTEVLYQDYDSLHDILFKYEFPNVDKKKANSFINKIIELYTSNLDNFDKDNPNSFSKEVLRQIIKAKRDKKNMLFLEDNLSYIISEGVFQIYINRMIEVKDKKVFDIEPTIIRNLEKLDENYQSKLKTSFVDSAKNREIQISDVICGFVGKLYSFIGHNNEEKITEFIKSLDRNSESFMTLKAFISIMEKSDALSPYLFHKTTPLFIERRFATFYTKIVSL